MPPEPLYARNPELFTLFYRAQECLASRLALRPNTLRAWLNRLPAPLPEATVTAARAKGWRTARLSSARRKELLARLQPTDGGGDPSAPLAAWLIASVPVGTLFEIAAVDPAFLPSDPQAEAAHRETLRLRDTLFHNNYGLAMAAARRFSPRVFPEMLSAASSGLLDAIDRYVPGAASARFAHFAGYWIRYHLVRQRLKSGSVVTLPVSLLRRRGDEPAPPRPQILSLHAPSIFDTDDSPLENCLRDPAPPPHQAAERAEIGERLQALLRARTAPATRVMLAYLYGLGSLPSHAQDFLQDLEAQALRRLGERTP